MTRVVQPERLIAAMSMTPAFSSRCSISVEAYERRSTREMSSQITTSKPPVRSFDLVDEFLDAAVAGNGDPEQVVGMPASTIGQVLATGLNVVEGRTPW